MRGVFYSFVCGRMLMLFVSDPQMASNLKVMFDFENVF